MGFVWETCWIAIGSIHPGTMVLIMDIVFQSRSGNKLLLSGGRCRVGVTHPKGIIVKEETVNWTFPELILFVLSHIKY